MNVSYSLVGVVRHHGATATSGHYTSLCKDNKLTASSVPAAGNSSVIGSTTAASASTASSSDAALPATTTSTTTTTTGTGTGGSTVGKGTTATSTTSAGTTGGGESKWGWEYDDAKKTAISADDALQATQTAYILLYCRN